MNGAMRAARSIAALGAVLAGLVIFVVAVGAPSYQPRTFDFDLVAFYCGGAVTAEHHDPYRVEPLRSCEHRVGPVFRRGSPLAVPDPLPPYDQAFFAAVAHAPYRVVQVAWFVALVAACAATAFLIAELCALPVAAVAAVLAISELYCSALLGQIVPFCVLGIVTAGWALERGKRGLTGAGLLLGMTEPHIGLPALAAVFLWHARSRVAVAIVVASLAVASLVVAPPQQLAEYFSSVIPAHAWSEINNQEQFSLAYVLHLCGVPETLALQLAKIEYAVMLVLGLVVARRASQRFGLAMLPFCATAFVLVGGPFLHVTQMVAALPAAFVLAGRAKSRVAAVAVCVLSVPWIDYATVLTVLPLAAGASYYAVRSFLPALRPVYGLGFAALGIAFVMAASFAVAVAPHPGMPTYGPVGPGALAETTWRALIDMQQQGHVVLSALAKVPTLCAVLGIAAVAVRSAALNPPPAFADHP